MTKKKSKKVNSKNKSNKDSYFIEENFDYLLKEVNKDKNLFLPGGPLKPLTMAGLPAATLPQASIPNQIVITPEMKASFNTATANAAKGLKAAGTATSVLGAAVDTAQMVKGAIDLSKTNDMSHVDAQANALANTEYNGTSYLDLSNQVANQIEVDDVSMEDLEGTAKDNWKQAGSVALKGASAGAAIGSLIAPGIGTAIGAGIGTLVGGASAGIGRLVKRKKAKNELDEYEEQKERAERKARQNLMSGIDSMISQNVQNEAAEFYALGGLINKFKNGGPAEEYVIVEDDFEPTPIEILDVDTKKYEPIIDPFTDSNKVLSIEKTPEDWLLQRKSQYQNNLSEYLGREVSPEEANNSLLEAINRMNATPATLMQPYHDTVSQSDNWRTERTTDTKTPESLKAAAARRNEKLGHSAAYREYSDPSKNNIIYNEDPLVFEELSPHERTYALMLKAAEDVIGNRNLKLREGYSKDDYLDNPKEIYARLMGARISEGMDPTKKYSVEEIKDILKDKEKHQLDRYSDEDLEFLFNKVAYNNPSNLNIKIPEQMQGIIPNEDVYMAAYGGPIHKEFSNGVTIINEGNTHENNPNEGVQVGVDPQGTPNLVEEGEVIFNDYVFSNRLTVPNKVRNKYKLRNNKDLSFADAAKDIQKMSEEMPNDPIVKRTMELKMSQLIQEQEMVRQKKNKNNSFSKGGELNKYGLGEWLKKGAKWAYNNGDTLMQTAPVFGSLLAVGNDIFGGNEPDYTNVKDYERAVKDAYNPIKAETLNDYIDYKPYDPFFELNKLGATQAASRRALLNTSQGNPAIARAMMLASDYNYGNQIGDTYRKALEFNDARQRQASEFNRGTRQFNAQAINAANQFNAQQAANKATALGQVAQWKDQIYNANRAEKSANLTRLYEGIAGLGETFMNLKDRRWLMDKGIIVGSDGKIIQLPNNESKFTSTLKGDSPYKLKTSSFPNTPTLSFDMDSFESKYGKYKKPTIKSNGGNIKRTKNKRRLS